MEKFGLNQRKIVIIALVILGFFLLMDLNNRLTELFRLSNQRDQMQAEVAALQRTQIILGTKIAYAESTQAVDEWAREQGHMVQEGDVPIIPIGQNAVTPTPIAQPTAIPRQVVNWEVWYALFFGQ
ncbi:MAG TPA: septum formation initiator family protein [Anaerolineaceae bacterium]|nr:septum formation initiator family protein [Anaerolineaceae bacterium]